MQIHSKFFCNPRSITTPKGYGQYLVHKEAAQDATIGVAWQNTEGGVVENMPEPFELVHTST